MNVILTRVMDYVMEEVDLLRLFRKFEIEIQIITGTDDRIYTFSKL